MRARGPVSGDSNHRPGLLRARWSAAVVQSAPRGEFTRRDSVRVSLDSGVALRDVRDEIDTVVHEHLAEGIETTA